MDLPRYIETLKRAGVDFAPGLTPAEMRVVEEAYGFRFPPDLAAFYFRGVSYDYRIEEPVKRIEFWSRIVDDNNEGFSDG